ncbi:MAG: proline reductase cluster protein PrdD [Peptoniphilus sp.]|nr:proline reductase cluster protein PrdD [Peptoniphilus sp.]MDY6045153.1 proline reductase cluster protein PrdD [Peptoniphilus sp.]
MEDIQKRRLAIRAFHVEDVEFGKKAAFSDGTLTVPEQTENKSDLVVESNVAIIEPHHHDVEVNSIMDIIPISTKVLGNLGEGVTHTFTGCYVLLTGVDEDGRQIGEFGSSEGNLKEQLMLGKRGTPGDEDFILHIDVLVKGGQPFSRELANAAFQVAEDYIQHLRKMMKQLNGARATESHEYYDVERKGGLKVVLLKQVAGQGAMYDNMVFPSEPSGFDGISVIDMYNMPVYLTPNEYRDGAIRALV